MAVIENVPVNRTNQMTLSRFCSAQNQIRTHALHKQFGATPQSEAIAIADQLSAPMLGHTVLGHIRHISVPLMGEVENLLQAIFQQ